MSNIKDLENKIVHCANLYYTGQDTISDKEFDDLVDELRSIDPNNILLKTTGWGFKVSDDNKIPHPIVSVGGLSKVKSEPDTIIKFRSATPKYDGASVELIYVNGVLSSSITRGDGDYGQNVTDHLIPIVGSELPLHNLSDNYINLIKNSVISISGEFILSKTSFRQNYPGEISYRNIPSGFLNRNNVTPEECRVFSFVPYRINGIITTRDNIDAVRDLSFRKSLQDFLNIEFNSDVPYVLGREISYKELMDQFKENTDFEFDGIVANFSIANKYSITEIDNNRIKVIYDYDELAYKVITDTKRVVVTKITWNLTRTGRLVPRIWFDPVQLSGAMVKKATGHNYDYIKSNNIGVGSVVEITRSGEVIPYVLKVITPSDNSNDLITICPECGEPLTITGADAICNNSSCPSKSYNKVYRWLSYLGEVKGAGGSIYSSMIEYGNINSVDDLYNKNINWSGISNMEGIGNSKIELVNKIIDQLNNPIKLYWFLVACNLKGVNSTTAKKLQDNSNILDCLISGDISKLDLSKCKGVGSSISDTLSNNWEYIINCFKYIKLDNKSFDDSDNSVNNSDKVKVCITGKLESGTKSDLYDRYSDKIVESDVKSCDILVCNKVGSSKYNKAVSLNKRIMSEAEFNEYINEV